MNAPRLKRVVVIPAGRRRYLELLFAHLETQKEDFDELQIWLNTLDQADIAFCRGWAKDRPWAACRDCEIPIQKGGIILSIHHFFRKCADPHAVYLRLDDDIVWLEPGFIARVFEYRIAHPEWFLVYGNVVNNAITSHLQQRLGNLPYRPSVNYECMDKVGWATAAFTHALHERFLAALEAGTAEDWKFKPWVLVYFERVSINAISWLGAEFAEFGGVVGRDEEQWLSVDKPKAMGKPNIILGDALCVHYAFYPQRDYLETTDILSRYAALTPALASA